MSKYLQIITPEGATYRTDADSGEQQLLSLVEQIPDILKMEGVMYAFRDGKLVEIERGLLFPQVAS
jgi:hypothetical protein